MFSRSILSFSLMLCCVCIFAQDTAWVQTLTFDSITTRKGWFAFPDGSDSYRKVLMYHTLKCDQATTADNFPCGEWDYLTYNYLYEHTGLLDSTALQHPAFLVGGASPDSLITTTLMGSNSYGVLRSETIVDSTMSENFFVLGTGGSVDLATLDNAQGRSRTQIVYTGSELSALGMQPGMIDQIRFNVNFAGDSIGRLTVRMKNTNVALFDEIDVLGLETVFDHSYAFDSGVNTIVFSNPFMWDGSSNILVDVGFDEVKGNTGTRLFATQGSLDLVGRTSGPDHYLWMGEDHLAVDAAPMANVNDEITVMCWVYGDPNALPMNTTLFEANDIDGNRMLNVHLPWSNSQVYWDAGNTGSGYDRINAPAQVDDLEGKWNHWAFTKNAASGEMKIFLNGALWHSGTGNTVPMSGITEFVIGSNNGRTTTMRGGLDDFAVFNVALDQATIEGLLNNDISAAHPNFADLLYYYDFNDAISSNKAVDRSQMSNDAFLMGSIGRRVKSGPEAFRLPVADQLRPDITFVSGSYTTSVMDSLHFVEHATDIVSKVDFQIIGNESLPYDTTWAQAGGFTYTLDPLNNVLDSMPIGGTWSYNGLLDYWSVPFPEVIRHELGRYITPYGINLSLGQGFTWIYDVTEYAHLLQDSVELSAGNQQELIDLRFAMIEGIPPREVVDIQYPWGRTRSYSYGNMDDDINLSATTLTTDPQADQWILRSRLTGHGHQSNTGNYPHCCEWKDNTHYIFANGTQVDDWHIWKTDQCALNPVFPQGGTWLGAREGWCPGDLVDVHETDLSAHVQGGQVQIDYDITDVPQNNQGMASGNYVASFEFVEFKAASHALDAEIYLVKRPSDFDYYRRFNPICDYPSVVLRNAGSTTLTSVSFTYGVSGGVPLAHTWTGSLEHMETVEVELPLTDIGFWGGDSLREFTVSVNSPNGGIDEYGANDSYTSKFDLPVVYNEPFIVQLKTNNRPNENSWTVKDIHGNVVASNGSLIANTIHYDTLNLPNGCYTFELLDSGNDGLSYWADPAAGGGYVRFKRVNGSFTEIFKSEFGKSIVHSFSQGVTVGVEEIKDPDEHIKLIPNPSAGTFNLQLAYLADDALIEIRTARGELIQSRNVRLTGDDRFEFSLTNVPNGLYLVRILNGDRAYTRKLIIEK